MHILCVASAEALRVIPSKTLDKTISKTDFDLGLGVRLGVDFCEGGHSCPLCAQLDDNKGRHCLSCMPGGDQTLEHNQVRNLIHDFCARGRLRPRLEAVGLLQTTSLPDGRRRPTDVLILSGACLSPTLPDGSRQVRNSNVALDFAVINALGQGHWHETNAAPTLAAENYALRKRQNENTEAKCRTHGVRFIPMVVESQGCRTVGFAKVLDAISGAVASSEGLEHSTVKAELLRRILLTLWRSDAYRIFRRLDQGSAERSSPEQRALDRASILVD